MRELVCDHGDQLVAYPVWFEANPQISHFRSNDDAQHDRPAELWRQRGMPSDIDHRVPLP